MSTITLIHETVIDAPAAMAWRVVADYSRDVDDRRRDVVRMVPTPTGLVQVGTTTAEEVKLVGRTYRNAGRVVALDPGSRFQWRTPPALLPTAPDRSRRSIPNGAACVSSCRSRRLASTGLSRRSRRGSSKALAGDVERLRERVETAAARHIDSAGLTGGDA